MSRPAAVAGALAALVLGTAAGVATIAVHRSPLGLLLGVAAAVAVVWTLRYWLRGAGVAFAAGWVLPLLVAVAGRAEGDYVVSSDLRGWLLLVSGGVVFVAGVVWGRPARRVHGSGALGPAT